MTYDPSTFQTGTISQLPNVSTSTVAPAIDGLTTFPANQPSDTAVATNDYGITSLQLAAFVRATPAGSRTAALPAALSAADHDKNVLVTGTTGALSTTGTIPDGFRCHVISAASGAATYSGITGLLGTTALASGAATVVQRIGTTTYASASAGATTASSAATSYTINLGATGGAPNVAVSVTAAPNGTWPTGEALTAVVTSLTGTWAAVSGCTVSGAVVTPTVGSSVAAVANFTPTNSTTTAGTIAFTSSPALTDPAAKAYTVTVSAGSAPSAPTLAWFNDFNTVNQNPSTSLQAACTQVSGTGVTYEFDIDTTTGNFGGTPVATSTGNANPWATFTGLTVGGAYVCRARARNSAGASGNTGISPAQSCAANDLTFGIATVPASVTAGTAPTISWVQRGNGNNGWATRAMRIYKENTLILSPGAGMFFNFSNVFVGAYPGSTTDDSSMPFICHEIGEFEQQVDLGSAGKFRTTPYFCTTANTTTNYTIGPYTLTTYIPPTVANGTVHVISMAIKNTATNAPNTSAVNWQVTNGSGTNHYAGNGFNNVAHPDGKYRVVLDAWNAAGQSTTLQFGITIAGVTYQFGPLVTSA